jgi:hypothetical protein
MQTLLSCKSGSQCTPASPIPSMLPSSLLLVVGEQLNLLHLTLRSGRSMSPHRLDSRVVRLLDSRQRLPCAQSVHANEQHGGDNTSSPVPTVAVHVDHRSC